MIDPFGRRITYLRLSVTDRCDLRCVYCMPERMRFLPRKDLLTLDEMHRLCAAFIARGVRKIRLTGGEPLVRKDLLRLIEKLSEFLGSGDLDELTMTTNGTRLADHAEALASHGIERVNVSLDSLDPATYRRLTRGGDVRRVIDGIDAAIDAGLAVKINAVALRNANAEELPDLAAWAHARGAALTIIEVMPMGETGADRFDQFIPLTEVRRTLEQHWTLVDLERGTGGPARYVTTDEGGTIGFISPLSRNFCASCNRVRVTCTGRLYQCLGQDSHVELAAPLRSHDPLALDRAIKAALAAKPKAHDFTIDRRGQAPAVERQMSVTGG